MAETGRKGRDSHCSPVGNLYPNRGNQPKRVEIPCLAGWKSLPKWRKPVEMGRDSHCRRSEISTQNAEISRKGRGSHCRRLEISTQMAEIGRKGRDFLPRQLEISTQMAKINEKGRKPRSRSPEISTQMAETGRNSRKSMHLPDCKHMDYYLNFLIQQVLHIFKSYKKG